MSLNVKQKFDLYALIMNMFIQELKNAYNVAVF